MSKKIELTNDVLRNRAAWDEIARDYAEAGRRCWQEEPIMGNMEYSRK